MTPSAAIPKQVWVVMYGTIAVGLACASIVGIALTDHFVSTGFPKEAGLVTVCLASLATLLGTVKVQQALLRPWVARRLATAAF